MKNKKLFVGTQTAVGQAVSAAKYSPTAAAVAGTAVSASPPYRAVTAVAKPVVAITQPPPRQSSWRGSPFVYPSDSESLPLRFLPSSAASQPPPRPAVVSQSRHRRPVAVAATSVQSSSSTASPPSEYYAVRPVDVNSIAADDGDDGSPKPAYYRGRGGTSSSTTELPPIYERPLRPHTFRPAYRKVDVSAAARETGPAEYDGVSFVRNGFKYYLPRHYHEERTDEDETRTGSFGYVDPFGIRRVVYYNAGPGTGFVHRKNNRYVGLDAEPYDPRPSPQ